VPVISKKKLSRPVLKNKKKKNILPHKVVFQNWRHKDFSGLRKIWVR
jgi:hypothetical protein